MIIPLNAETGIILQRLGGRVATNVPRTITYHSPDGFEFGYGGSGPADLALNIVEFFLHELGFEGERTPPITNGSCFLKAWDLHQPFKREFIASADRNGATIPYNTVLEWVKARL